MFSIRNSSLGLVEEFGWEVNLPWSFSVLFKLPLNAPCCIAIKLCVSDKWRILGVLFLCWNTWAYLTRIGCAGFPGGRALCSWRDPFSIYTPLCFSWAIWLLSILWACGWRGQCRAGHVSLSSHSLRNASQWVLTGYVTDPIRSFQGRTLGGAFEKLSIAGAALCGNTGLQTSFVGLIPQPVFWKLPGGFCVFGWRQQNGHRVVR